MARSAVTVRDAVDTDLDVLASWSDSIREEGARQGPFAPPPDSARFRERIARLHADDRHRLLVVEADDEPVGMAVLVAEPVSPLADDLAVQIAYLHVRDGSRRRGAGRALVAAAAELAGELGAEYVTVATLPHARESQRYFARLGFGPLVVRRAALTSALQLRLARGESGRLLLARRRLAGRRVAERLVG